MRSLDGEGIEWVCIPKSAPFGPLVLLSTVATRLFDVILHFRTRSTYYFVFFT